VLEVLEVRLGRKRYIENSSGETDYSLSISDLMSALLAIFVLALTYYILSYSQARAQLVENQDKRSEILQMLQAELKAQGINVEVDYKHGILRLPEGILFAKGDAELNESGKQVIAILAPALLRVLEQPTYATSVETIFIEGHTDSDPIRGGKYKSNWELSTQRAINTWRQMRETEPKLETLVNALDEPVFSVSGYADRRPVALGDSEEAKAKNRRIDLRFSMTPPRSENGPERQGGEP
jgi:flagellar motor protein MotB